MRLTYTLFRISDPSEEVILGFSAPEEDLLAVQNLDEAARRLGLDYSSRSARLTLMERSSFTLGISPLRRRR